MNEEEKLKELDEKNKKALNELYDKETIEESNQMFDRMTEEELSEIQSKAHNILVLLKEAHETKDPASMQSQKLVQKHKEWLAYTWPEYSVDLHRGLGEHYATDEGLVKYYDDFAGQGAAEFFKVAIVAYTENNSDPF